MVLTLCIQITDIFFSVCCGPFGFAYTAPKFNLVTSFSAERTYATSLCLPEKSSVHLRLAASPVTSLPAASGAGSCGTSPVFFSFQLSEGICTPPRDGFLPSCPGDLSLPGESKFPSRFRIPPSTTIFWDTFVLHSPIQLASLYPRCRQLFWKNCSNKNLSSCPLWENHCLPGGLTPSSLFSVCQNWRHLSPCFSCLICEIFCC